VDVKGVIIDDNWKNVYNQNKELTDAEKHRRNKCIKRITPYARPASGNPLGLEVVFSWPWGMLPPLSHVFFFYTKREDFFVEYLDLNECN